MKNSKPLFPAPITISESPLAVRTLLLEHPI